MSRPREFDREEVLDKAVEVFWARGFEATSMSGLVAELGIGRQSLYATFGDKQQLFAEALGRYIGFNNARIDALLGGDAGLAGIRAFLKDSAGSMASSRGRRGCLIFNSCVELGPHDPDVNKQLSRGLRHLRRGFEVALARAKADGVLSTDASTSALAGFLTLQLAGMAVMARGGASIEELRAGADLACAALG